ncbi:MAG: AAA family ATPase, partial [Pseudomonadota bacterium]
MRLTRLRLNGFKSFVDPTELVIHEGLTGVVGPNGCGKSNLLEALRWVMGENRASAMRGGEMEDVIFAGASTRPARHFAEVAITIDNSERLAPPGLNDADQVEIVRRITRDAGSAYRGNGRELRARDVQMLFADASTGAHSPALVRQGQIAELINARPKNRRRILEEAAGISGLYQRRHEAELKLTAAEQNLLRVDDVVEGLAQQIASLARQARQAARYREISEDLRRAEGMLLWRRWREADEARAAAETDLRGRIRAAGLAEAAARRAVAGREEAEGRLPPLREEAAVAGAVLQRLVVERDGLSDREARARGAVAAITERIGQIGQDIGREEALNRDAEETIARLAEELAGLAAASAGHDERLAEAQAAAKAAAEALDARESGFTEATEDTARLAARHQSAQRLAADNRAVLDRSLAEAAKAQAAADEAEQTLIRATAAAGK